MSLRALRPILVGLTTLAVLSLGMAMPALADSSPVSGAPAQAASPAPEASLKGQLVGVASLQPALNMTGSAIVDIPQAIVAGGGDATFVKVNADGSFTVSVAHVVTPQIVAATGAGPSSAPVAAPVLGYLYSSDTSASPANLPGCFSYGTARGLSPPNTCLPAHWERFNTVHAYMYVEDYTSSAWPVYAAQIKWNQSCCVGAYYASPGTCSFHCVQAHDANYGNTFWDGLFSYNYDSNHHFTSGSLKYNDYYKETYNQHLTDTCHEQGHALGLNHNTNTNSCMYASGYNSTVPDGDDYGELQYNIYNH